MPDGIATSNQPFSKPGQSDWAKSLKRLSRAQALAWDALPIKERLALLQRVDDEQKGQQ